MLRARTIALGSALAALAVFGSACGGNTAENTGGAGGEQNVGGSGGGTGAGGPLILENPPEPGPETPGDGAGQVLAIRKLFLGNTDRNGVEDDKAWMEYGFDIDGKASTKASKDLCQPAAGATPDTVYPDGKNGIDNSFGANILPTVIALAPAAASGVNDSIDSGSFTIMLDIKELGTGENYNPLKTFLYGGANFDQTDDGVDQTPAWDGSDEWPVVYELLNNGDINDPLVQFPSSYVVTADGKRWWVSGTAGTLVLNLAVGGYTLAININEAQIAMELGADNQTATNGTISGVIETEQLIDELAKVAGSIDTTLCPPSSTFDNLANQIRQASDVLQDGTQDPAKTCDGISIGLGFEMQSVKLGTVADKAMMQPDPCTM